jgi:anhydro-N-acetylmuramic acid kinase
MICGTSGDGVSAALVQTDGYETARRVDVLAHTVHPYPPDIRDRLFALFLPQRFSASDLGHLHRDLGELLAGVALAVVELGRRAPEDLTAVAVHAPTLFHEPPTAGRLGIFMEVGEAAIIAERTGTRVVCELRPSDLAAGGHGAPLSAYADYVLFAHPERGRAVQNIGGIANVTYLPPQATIDDVLSFDTGPGNMVIDGVVSRLTDGQSLYDQDGQLAAQGRVNEDLLNDLLTCPYVQMRPPKTTGREDFGEPFVRQVLVRAETLHLSAADIAATVTAFTAECIRLHYERELAPRGPLDEVIVYGGGAHNPTLLRMIETRIAPVRLRRQEEFGIPGDAREAVTWTILADETLAGHAGNVPAASGARHRVVLGKIVDPRPKGER